MRLPTFSAAQKIKLFALLLAIANSVLVYGATVSAVPGIPGWVAYCWPFVYGLAVVIHGLASVFGVQPNAQIAAALDRAHMAGVVAGAKEMQAQLSTQYTSLPKPHE